ncbi:MAG TPA: hypothetical protein VJ453_10440 [Terriglobales bacterium]|jgi:hypothetical protein|nr:hypothetical protein [Terriglobales bacterium]
MNLLLPELNIPLWRSLLVNLRDTILPKRLPALQLTSRPVNVGMLVGDILEVPWYRTILSNIGDLISPETLPPLQLESQPVEVELISDQPAWWRSLLRNLADAAAPERQPVLHRTSAPVNPKMGSEVLITPRWSSLIETPEVFLRDPWKTSFDRPERLDRPVPVAPPIRTTLVQLPSLSRDAPVSPGFYEFERKLVVQLRRSISRSHAREFLWGGVIVAEVTALLVLELIGH